MKLRLKKVIAVGVFALSTGIITAQGVKKSQVKIDDLRLPRTTFSTNVNYSIAINKGELQFAQDDLYKKKARLQSMQDNINNAGSMQYYTQRTFSLVPQEANPDVQVSLNFGKFEITEKDLNDHKIPCTNKNEKLSKDNLHECPAFYYEVSYKLPIIMVVKAKDGEVLYAEEIQNNTDVFTTTFGYDKNGLSGYLQKSLLDKAFTEQPVLQNAVTDAMDKCEDIVQSTFFFHFSGMRFDIATGKGNFDYSSLDNAKESVEEAFGTFKKERNNSSFITATDAAVNTWMQELESLDKGDKKARINTKLGYHIKMNLAYTHYFRQEFDKALIQTLDARKMSESLANTEFRDESSWMVNRINSKIKNIAIQKVKIDVNEPLEKVVVMLSIARLKAKNTPHTFIFDKDNYVSASEENKAFQAILSDQTANIEKEQSDKVATSSSKNNKYESQIITTSTQGNMLIVNAYSDKLEVFPTEICELVQLNQLTVNGQPFETIPESLGQLKHLKILKLNNNKLKELPSSIGQLSEMKTLSLKGNQLTNLPEELGDCKELKKLVLTGNAIPQEQIDKIKKALPKCKISV